MVLNGSTGPRKHMPVLLQRPSAWKYQQYGKAETRGKVAVELPLGYVIIRIHLIYE